MENKDIDPFDIRYVEVDQHDLIFHEAVPYQQRGYEALKSHSKVHKLYLDLAKRFSEESKDPRMKVGCVIATASGILYPGYNGDAKGGSNKPKSLEPGQSGFLHAEDNAIIKFNPTIHPNSILYVTHNPCETCATRIINTGVIVAVYYSEDYRTKDGVDLLREMGIPCDKLCF